MYLRVLNWFRGTPDWFKAATLGGLLVLSTILALAYAGSASAEDVAQLKVRVTRVEYCEQGLETQLLRIERKLDQLILRLIPNPD